MSFDAAEETIRTRFNTQWATLQPTVPVVYDNQGAEPATSRNDGPWVKLVVLGGTSQQVEMGAAPDRRRWRRPGVVSVNIFIPAGSGTGLATELADSVREIFEGRTVSGVIFRATSLNRVGITENWMQYAATTPFQRDEIR